VDGGTKGLAIVRIDTLDAATSAIPAALQAQTEQKLIVGPIMKGPIGAFSMTVDNVRIWPRSDL
jgi:hypothetical protein